MMAKERILSIKSLKFFLACLIIFHMVTIGARIRLMTFHHNRPDFLELQCQCINKFLKEKDDYDLIVINDATDPYVSSQIADVCKMYGAQCIIYPQELHSTGALLQKMQKWGHDHNNGSVRHCQLVQYALDNFGYDHDDIVGIFEGDVFLTRELSLREKLREYDLIGAVQTDRDGAGIEYIWIGLSFFNIKNLPNKKKLCFDLHVHEDQVFLDSGGSSYYYLKDNPSVPVKKYYRMPIGSLPRNNKAQLEAMGFSPKEVSFLQSMVDYKPESNIYSLEYHMDYHFIHFSFSRYSDNADNKSKLFMKYILDILEPSGKARMFLPL